jgi:hypothetical protein
LLYEVPKAFIRFFIQKFPAPSASCRVSAISIHTELFFYAVDEKCPICENWEKSTLDLPW